MSKPIVKIIIPSHKRWDKVYAKNAITNGIICVPQSQFELYKEHNPDCEIVAHPDEIRGIVWKSQWIFEKFGDIFLIDDDVRRMERVYLNPNEKQTKYDKVVDPKTCYDLVQNLAYMCREVNAFLFAFGGSPSPLRYDALRPFKVTGGVCNFGKGILSGGKLFFYKELIIGNDPFISLINAYYHRYLLIDNRFAFIGEMISNTGGLADYRTYKEEERTTQILRKLFGNALRIKKQSKWRRRDARHPFERSIDVPF